MQPINISTFPTFSDLQAAQARIQGYLNINPVIEVPEINRCLKAKIVFKCENFQVTGSFKFRGALNAILSLTERQRRNGVAAHSSGNHGLALAQVARQFNIPCTIVVPHNAPLTKRSKLEKTGANIVFCEPTLAAREQALKAVLAATKATEIHSSNHRDIIAGAGSVALELLAEVPDLEMLVAPVGGGGLLSGVSLVAAHHTTPVQVFGAEPMGADDARCSLQAGRIIRKPANTVADGLRSALGTLTFGIIRQNVSDILLVSDEEILTNLQWLYRTTGVMVEPSAAIALGAIATHPSLFTHRKVGVILSGGNGDASILSSCAS
ncbi:MAG: threonine/serine dehydratase [Spirulinaceae cyanobacterium]